MPLFSEVFEDNFLKKKDNLPFRLPLSISQVSEGWAAQGCGLAVAMSLLGVRGFSLCPILG